MSAYGSFRLGGVAGAANRGGAWPLLVVWLLVAGCHSESPLEQAAALQREGQREEAMELLRDEIAAGNREPELLYRYGVALARGGGISPAFWPLREAAADPEWFAPATLEIARGAYRTGNYDHAVDELDGLVEREPENTEALKLRAMARLHSRRDYEGALEDIDRVTELDPTEIDMRVPRIVALLGLGQTDEAGEALAGLSVEDLEGEDKSTEGLVTMGKGFEILACAASAKFAEEQGEMELAQARYEECLERFPAASLVIKESLDFFQEKGDFQRVEEILRKAYEAGPKDRSIRIAWARTLQLKGQVDEAEAVLRDAAESLLLGAWLDLG
ncbi:MAG: tetratricopeptide repeat protein, partial [Myxococcota bacterium]